MWFFCCSSSVGKRATASWKSVSNWASLVSIFFRPCCSSVRCNFWKISDKPSRKVSTSSLFAKFASARSISSRMGSKLSSTFLPPFRINSVWVAILCLRKFAKSAACLKILSLSSVISASACANFSASVSSAAGASVASVAVSAWFWTSCSLVSGWVVSSFVVLLVNGSFSSMKLCLLVWPSFCKYYAERGSMCRIVS